MGKPKKITSPEELTCENCGTEISDEEDTNNDGYCNECAYEVWGEDPPTY